MSGRPRPYHRRGLQDNRDVGDEIRRGARTDELRRVVGESLAEVREGRRPAEG